MSGRIATRSQSRILREVNNGQTVSENKQTKNEHNLNDETTGNVVVYFVQNGNEIVEHR